MANYTKLLQTIVSQLCILTPLNLLEATRRSQNFQIYVMCRVVSYVNMMLAFYSPDKFFLRFLVDSIHGSHCLEDLDRKQHRPERGSHVTVVS